MIEVASSVDLDVLDGEVDLVLSLDDGLDSSAGLRLREFSNVVLDRRRLLVVMMGDGKGARGLFGVGGGTVGLSVLSVGRTRSDGTLLLTDGSNWLNGSANILGVFISVLVSVSAREPLVDDTNGGAAD